MPDYEPTPADLWRQADRECVTPEMRRGRYLELMRQHGYLIDREPGDNSPMFACGFDPRSTTPEDARSD